MPTWIKPRLKYITLASNLHPYTEIGNKLVWARKQDYQTETRNENLNRKKLKRYVGIQIDHRWAENGTL